MRDEFGRLMPSAPRLREGGTRRRTGGASRSPEQELLDRMLDGFDATYGTRAPRSVLVSTAARDALAVSSGFADSGPADASRERAMTPVGWYRGVPVDLVSHDRDWLVAVIATRSSGSAAPVLYGDVRSGKISAEFPQRAR